MTKENFARFCPSKLVKPSTFGIRHSAFRAGGAFTLIELIVVFAVIIILTGLVLSTVGYVQKKGARARAETEIAAISAALESYKADNGIYPRDVSSTDALNSTNDGNPADYLAACRYVYGEITGDRDFDGSTDSAAKSYITLKPTSLLRADMSQPPSSTNPVTAIRDPFGYSYGYSTRMAATGSGGYNPTFDLWSTCSLTTSPPSTADQSQWIKNW
jgi:type II secretory pathway pseudopilin PulG